MSSYTRSRLMMDYLPWHFNLAESEDDHDEEEKNSCALKCCKITSHELTHHIIIKL